MKTEYQKVSVYELDPGTKNENNHEVEEIQNLAKNIEEVGLLNPITVTTANGGYEIIAGRARWRAFQELEREEIPAVIIEGVEEPTKSLQRADENYYRTNLDVYERAELMWNLKQQGLSRKELESHFKLKKRRVNSNLSMGEFLSKIEGDNRPLPSDSKVTTEIVNHFRDQGEIPKDFIEDINKTLDRAIEDNWSQRDVSIWKKSRKEGQLAKDHVSNGATAEQKRKQKEKSDWFRPTEEQNGNREEPTNKVKESEEEDVKEQLDREEEELEQKDRILDQRKQKHRKERHQVQKALANIKEQSNKLRDNLKKIQYEDKIQYISEDDGVLLIEVVGRLVTEATNTAEVLKGEFNYE